MDGPPNGIAFPRFAAGGGTQYPWTVANWFDQRARKH